MASFELTGCLQLKQNTAIVMLLNLTFASASPYEQYDLEHSQKEGIEVEKTYAVKVKGRTRSRGDFLPFPSFTVSFPEPFWCFYSHLLPHLISRKGNFYALREIVWMLHAFSERTVRLVLLYISWVLRVFGRKLFSRYACQVLEKCTCYSVKG